MDLVAICVSFLALGIGICGYINHKRAVNTPCNGEEEHIKQMDQKIKDYEISIKKKQDLFVKIH